MQEPSAHDEFIKKPLTIEEILSPINGNQYELMGAINAPGDLGAIGLLSTNESISPGGLDIGTPDGYIVGSGNGAIWEMLENFPQGNLPKGIVSMDINPDVILSGKILVALAKGQRGDLTADEAMNWLYGKYIFPKSNPTLKNIEKEKIETLAKEVIFNETNPKFQKVLMDNIENGTFFAKLQQVRQIFEEEGFKGPKHKKDGSMNISAIINNNWDSIKRLAKEGKIFFAHSDIANPNTIQFIADSLPDIKNSKNIIYTSNIVDSRYRKEVDVLEKLNPSSLSSYVFTTRADNYVLKSAKTPPRRAN